VRRRSAQPFEPDENPRPEKNRGNRRTDQ